MTVRIDCAAEGERTVVRVGGDLRRDDVSPLLDTCRELGVPIVLDLEGLLSVDSAAIAAIRDLLVSGVAVRNCSQFLSLMIEGRSGDC